MTLPVLACDQLGPARARQEHVKDCGARLRDCNYYAEVCTTSVPREGVRCCATCKYHPDRRAAYAEGRDD